MNIGEAIIAPTMGSCTMVAEEARRQDIANNALQISWQLPD
jgi:hypothetical protein